MVPYIYHTSTIHFWGDEMKTTIYLPNELYEKAKDAGVNFSAVSRRAIEHELYGDNPKFIEGKLRDVLKSKQHHEKEIEQLREDLQKANNKQQERKKRLGEFNPNEVNDYRTITPKGGK